MKNNLSILKFTKIKKNILIGIKYTEQNYLLCNIVRDSTLKL